MRATSERLSIEAEAIVFGFEPAPVTLTVRPRSGLWRIGGAIRTMVTFLLLAPIVALAPPHAPWAIGAVAGGGFLARRRWLERFTLERVEGACPKCGESLKAKSARLRFPHPLACEACHHQAALRIAPHQAALLGSLPQNR